VELTRDVVVWGLVGGLSFLVLLTGYELATGFRARLEVKAGVAVLVTVGATVASAALATRLRENESA
jgi:hypothetical protein